jgi:membrane fusion protein (multidrug efflux system)
MSENKITPRKIITLVGIIAVVCGIIYTIITLVDYQRFETTNDAQIEQYVSPINIRVPGYVEKIFFTGHQFVHKGDTLLIIDPREYQIRLKEAQAAMMDAQAGENVLNAGIATSQSNATVYESSIAELEVKIAKLERDYVRYQNLLQVKAVTEVQVESVKTELDMTREHLKSVQQQQRTAQSNVKEVSTRKANNAAAQLKASAAMDMALLNLSYTVVIAPCDGRVGRRTMEEGQLVAAGQTLTSIIPDAPKWVIANFKETQLKNIQIGQEVSIKIDAFDDKTFLGHVREISGATGSQFSLIPSDNATGNFVKIQQRVPVRIDFDNLSAEDNSRFAAGMMAEVKIKPKK